MRLDTVIIGGGLSGLTCGIALARMGHRVAIVSSGPGSLRYSGGSMELLGRVDGHDVAHPLEDIASLPAEHPYRRLGPDRCAVLAEEAHSLLADAGIELEGTAAANHWRVTPLGMLKPAWLTLRGMATSAHGDRLPWRDVTLLDLGGFIDQPVALAAHNLRRLGAGVSVKGIGAATLPTARRGGAEARATGLARLLTSSSRIATLAEAINQVADDDEVVLMPAVLGIEDNAQAEALCSMVRPALRFWATMPPSVPGDRMAAQLRHYFKMLGGIYLPGDTVNRVDVEAGAVRRVYTAKSREALEAGHYVLAAGSFMSQGLMSAPDRIFEPLLGLDIDAPAQGQWCAGSLLGDQPFMRCGVVTDDAFRPLLGGTPLDNLCAIGSILGGHDPLAGGDGTGVSLLTALAVAHGMAGGRHVSLP